MTDFLTLIVAGIIGEAMAALVPVLVIVAFGVVGLYSLVCWLDGRAEPPAPRPVTGDDTDMEEWYLYNSLYDGADLSDEVHSHDDSQSDGDDDSGDSEV